MAYKYIIGALTTAGKFELLAGTEVDFGKQKEILEKNTRNEKFREVQMFRLEPHTRAYHPAATLATEKSQAEAETAAKKEAEAKAKAVAEAAEPEEFKGKSLAQLLKAARQLKLDFPASPKREDVIAGIQKAAADAEAAAKKEAEAKAAADAEAAAKELESKNSPPVGEGGSQ